MGTIPITDDARSHLRVVSVNPVVKLPDEMTYMGPGQAAALMLGGPLVGSLIANNSAAAPKAQLAGEMQAGHIVLGDIVAAEFAKQATDNAGPTKFVVGTAPADAPVELSVNAYAARSRRTCRASSSDLTAFARDNEKGLPREPFACATRPGDQAALSHIAVSNALLISGMFVPKPALALAFVLAFGAGFSMTGAASAARSHDPFS